MLCCWHRQNFCFPLVQSIIWVIVIDSFTHAYLKPLKTADHNDVYVLFLANLQIGSKWNVSIFKEHFQSSSAVYYSSVYYIFLKTCMKLFYHTLKKENTFVLSVICHTWMQKSYTIQLIAKNVHMRNVFSIFMNTDKCLYYVENIYNFYKNTVLFQHFASFLEIARKYILSIV